MKKLFSAIIFSFKDLRNNIKMVEQFSNLNLTHSSLRSAFTAVKAVNFIGALNEYCQRKKIGEPVYTNIEQEGPCHSPTFKYQCYVQDQKFFGEGLTKKIAKENSAKSATTALNIFKEKELIQTFRIVQVGSEEQTLKLLWGGAIDKLEIVVKRKNGDQQDFKTFYLTLGDDREI